MHERHPRKCVLLAIGYLCRISPDLGIGAGALSLLKPVTSGAEVMIFPSTHASLDGCGEAVAKVPHLRLTVPIIAM